MTQVRGTDVTCDVDARRALVANDPAINGIDYVEVADPDVQLVLEVFFIGKTVNGLLAALDGQTGKITIEGGVRVRHIRVTAAHRVGDHLEVTVDQYGDHSTYTLVINEISLDPIMSRCDFSFKAGCRQRFDCKPPVACPPDALAEPLIDYMAKDYASFRQALIDLIPTVLPGWMERHEADLGIALLELLAYTGDQLSYFQDAVANEAYLSTARQRISVRRHARLIDYRMHDGTSARVFLFVDVDSAGTLPARTQVLTRIAVPIGNALPPHPVQIPASLAEAALDQADAVFETLSDTLLHPDLRELTIHSWSDLGCCLPRGATSIDLEDPHSDLETLLHPSDFLLLEEVRGLPHGLCAEADPTHRQVVRLTGLTGLDDPIEHIHVVRVTWDTADALTFPLCISALDEGGHYFAGSVARANIVLADHGRTLEEWHPDDPALGLPGITVGQRPYRFTLRQGPLSFRIADTGRPVASMLTTDPRAAVPQVLKLETQPAATSESWKPAADLLESGPFSADFVIETDNDGGSQIRFGDDRFGLAPPNTAHIRITYRVGVGASGNVGAESFGHIVGNGSLPALRAIRNALPSWGGIDPEAIEHVKLLAPAAFRAEQFRAVTEGDYATAAERQPEILSAVADFSWTGSWHTVFITVLPRATAELTSGLKSRVLDWISGYTQAGYDLEILPPLFVPLDLTVTVCVAPDHFRGDVERALADSLGTGVIAGGRPAFFNHNNWVFGKALYVSDLYAAIQSVEGVTSARITGLKRLDGLDPDVPERTGYVPIGRHEVVRLDNDPNFPENGVLELTTQGGK